MRRFSLIINVISVVSLTLLILLSACSPASINLPESSAEASNSELTLEVTNTPVATSDDPAPISTSQKPLLTPEPPQQTTESISGTLTVHYIDVGQADSIFIELPNDQTMLIDAGNNADGIDVVRYLTENGYTSIDYIVGTHPHEDHIGGMDNVIDSLEIKNIYMPRASSNTQTFEDLLLAIQNKGLTVTTAKAGVSILEVPDLKISILAPNSSNYEELNDYSAVVKLIYKDTSFLFMGDAEENSELEIIADINADVLKIGHHGSSSSTGSAFLKKVSPIFAVISVGQDNKYGHPTQQTIDKLINANVKIYRTDLNGTIIISTDGSGYDIKTQKTASEAATPTSTVSPSPTPKATKAPVVTATVYITKTGEKYHADGCRYLKKSKIAILLSDAIARGYEPCSVCNPPT